MERAPHLRLVQGGRHVPVHHAGVELVAGSASDQPFSVDARVVEEDTWRLLSPAPRLQSTSEHPVRLMTDLVHDRPRAPGSVLVGRHRWRAVIYDLERDPICREDWVAAALAEILRLSRRHGTRTLALPLLGSTHGPLGPGQSLDLLLEALQRPVRPRRPERIWLQVAGPHLRTVVETLQERAAGHAS